MQLAHHNYFDLPPGLDNLRPNQRTARDLFIPEELRQGLLKKTEASLRAFSSK